MVIVHVESVWANVPDSKRLRELVVLAKNKRKDNMERQKAINLLNKAILIMKTVSGRTLICDFLAEVIEETRQDLYT